MKLAVLVLVTLAPFQCAHAPDPSARREDTAGDALWALAEDFRAHHEEAAARATLTFLVEHYPSSRHAPAARADLAASAPSTAPASPATTRTASTPGSAS